MAFYILCTTIFIMFFQPANIFPALEPYQPLRNSAVLALVAFIFSHKQASSVPFFKNKINRYFVLFAAAQIASSAALWMTGAFETFNLWLRMGIVYYLLVQSAARLDRVRWIVLMIVFAIAYLSYFSISKFIVDFQPGMRAGGFGWYENSNDIAIILVSAIPLCFLAANTARGFPARLVFLLLAGVFSFNILFTGSRNGLLGLLAVGVLGILSSNRVSGFLRTVLLAALVGAVLTVGVANVLSRGDLAGSGLRGDDSSEDRIEQWKAGMRMLKDHPLLGVGPGEFVGNIRDYGGIPGMEPHNTLVKVFVETGIPGGIFYCMFSFLPFLDVRKLLRDRARTAAFSEEILYLKLISAGLAGFWVCAFFSNRYQFYILYVLVALHVAVMNGIRSKEIQALKTEHKGTYGFTGRHFFGKVTNG